MIVSSAIDLVVMKNLSKFEAIKLLAIILEHMCKILIVKDEKYGLGYKYFLIKIFGYFRILHEAREK